MAIAQSRLFEAKLPRSEASEAIDQILDRAFPVGEVGNFTSLIEAIDQENASPERMLFSWGRN
jgi:hypothetical protein